MSNIDVESQAMPIQGFLLSPFLTRRSFELKLPASAKSALRACSFVTVSCTPSSCPPSCDCFSFTLPSSAFRATTSVHPAGPGEASAHTGETVPVLAFSLTFSCLRSSTGSSSRSSDLLRLRGGEKSPSLNGRCSHTFACQGHGQERRTGKRAAAQAPRCCWEDAPPP